MDAQNQLQQIVAQTAKVTAATFAAKFTNKREIYRFLASEAH